MRSSHQPDLILLGTIAFMVFFGLIMVSSASIGLSQEHFGQSYFYLKNQVIKGLFPGVILAFIAYLFPTKFWKKVSFPLLVATILLLLLVFIPGVGVKIGGASRWVHFGPTNFQPSEFLKISFIIYLAAWLDGKGKDIKDLSQGLMPFLMVMGIIALLIIKEPDIGTLGVIGFTAVGMYFLAGARITHLSIIGAGSAILFWILTRFFSHASNRLQIFLHPELDPQGIGYQINQAILAIGSGGFFGLGLGQGLQKFKYLPAPASDSIVAVIGEELGFLGILCLVLLFVIFAFRGFKAAQNAKDNFSKYLAAGITLCIIIQAFINICAISGLLPLTGITIPFFSLGGSSLAISLASMGILLKISQS